MIAKYLLLTIAGGALLAQGIRAQDFDAASIRRNTGGAPSGSTTMNKGSLVVQNVPLRACIALAYSLKAVYVIGPSWLDNDRYDITARTSSPDPGQMYTMYQKLLADRFALRVHPGTKVVPGFDLVADKGGIKFQNIGPQPATDPVADFGRGNALRIISPRGMTMAMLASDLSSKLQAPVNDKTGATDYYVGFLEWAPPNASPDNPPPPEFANRPSLFEALQEKGLHLQATKVTVPTIIVDSIERTPTEN
jgi:uncharacterized protein (TIGR03435 family)